MCNCVGCYIVVIPLAICWSLIHKLYVTGNCEYNFDRSYDKTDVKGIECLYLCMENSTFQQSSGMPFTMYQIVVVNQFSIDCKNCH